MRVGRLAAPLLAFRSCCLVPWTASDRHFFIFYAIFTIARPPASWQPSTASNPNQIPLHSRYGDQAGGIFVGKPISELHLSASVALVICLRPRLPQTPLAVEAKMSRREKLANELVENGQANVSKASESLADQGEEEDTKELTLDEQVGYALLTSTVIWTGFSLFFSWLVRGN